MCSLLTNTTLFILMFLLEKIPFLNFFSHTQKKVILVAFLYWYGSIQYLNGHTRIVLCDILGVNVGSQV